ncbi:restriction endonuclease [Erythrobacter colymbi]|uniref:restriction endonuclease n=1 Tax=Erythrobacter colymbi TaxID=1161202 RepID=UPI000A3B873E|nr:restriction endonuclease [Erythrobacter colymbi]
MKLPLVVASLEEEIGLNGGPRDLQRAIEAVLVSKHGLPPIQSAEHADRLKDRIASFISEREATTLDAGGSPVLRVIGSVSTLVAGFCYPLPGEDPELNLMRARRAHVSAIFDRMRALSFAEFEKFGARFLRELGARIGRVTPQSNDQGIDFYGEFSLRQVHAAPEPFLVLAKEVRLLFAGQAKHYPNRSIGPSEIRELIGALTLARTKTHSSDGVDIFKDLSIRPFTPVMALIFTTGELTSGAVRLSEAAGIIAKTGLQLAVFLADRGVGLVGGEGNQNFDEHAFLDWLHADA